MTIANKEAMQMLAIVMFRIGGGQKEKKDKVAKYMYIMTYLWRYY